MGYDDWKLADPYEDLPNTEFRSRRHCDVVVDGEVCGDIAPHTIVREDAPGKSVDVSACDEHAIEALERGELVLGPQGYPCRLLASGLEFEEVTW